MWKNQKDDDKEVKQPIAFLFTMSFSPGEQKVAENRKEGIKKMSMLSLKRNKV